MDFKTTNVKKGITARMKILEAIKEYHKKNGYPPTVREIGDIAGFKSSSSVHKHLERLKEEGKILWNPTMCRTITVVGEA